MANDRFKRMFDQVRPSPEQEEAMLARLLREEEKEARPMRRNWRRTAVFAIIAALLLAAVAFAVATVLDPAFLEHFGAGPKDEPLLGRTAVDVNLTAEPLELISVGNGYAFGGPLDPDTANTGTFFIRQAVVDRYSAKFLIDYTAPEGMVLDGDFYFPDANYVLRGDEDWDIRPFSWTSQWEMVEDEDPSDGRITMLLTLLPMDSDGELIGTRLLIRFTNLYAAESWDAVMRNEQTAVIEGAWDFPMLNLPKEDPGTYCAIDQDIEIEGKRAVLKSVYVSPISLVCDLEQEEVKKADSLSGIPQEHFDKDVALVMNRRKRVHMEGEGCSFLTAAGMPYPDISGTVWAHLYYRPERIIDPAEVAAVECFGQTITLK